MTEKFTKIILSLLNQNQNQMIKCLKSLMLIPNDYFLKKTPQLLLLDSYQIP